MAKVDFGYNVGINLEAGEEILFKSINDPNNLSWKKDDDQSKLYVSVMYEKADTFKDTLISKLSFGFAGPKLVYNTQLIVTNKRIVLIPFPNSKRTKTENYTTRELYYNKEVRGAEAAYTQNDTMYAECINAWLEILPIKGVDLKGMKLMLRLNLSKEEMTEVSKSMQRQMENKKTIKRVEELASQIEYDNFFDAFSTHARVDAWKAKVKKMNKISVLGDKSILPIRDFIIWTINNAVEEAK